MYEMAALTPPFPALNLNLLYREVMAGDYLPIPNFYSQDLASTIKNLI